MRIRRSLARVLCVAAMVTGLTAVVGGVAHADTEWGSITPASASIGGLFTNFKCLDLRAQDGFTNPNARIQQWDCSGANEQQWQSHPYAWVQLPGSGIFRLAYQIKSLRSGMCVEVRGSGTVSGTQVDQNYCAPDGGSADSSPTQLWIATTAEPNTFALQPWSAVRISAPLCMDVRGNTTDNGAMIQVFSCRNQPNQEYFGAPLTSS